MTESEFGSLPDDLAPEVRGAGAATWALSLLGLAALAAAVAARLAAPEALYDRYLILAAVGAGIAAVTVRRRPSRTAFRLAVSAFVLLAIYAVALLAVPPPHAGLKALLARAFPSDPKLFYVEGGNGVASLWSEASEWRAAPSPSSFEASRGDVRLRIERIGGVGEQAELGDYADLALANLVDRGELIACDAEGPGAYGDRLTAWRAFAAHDDETDESPLFGVYVVYVDGDSVFGARVDAPTREGMLEAAPAAREVLAVATSDPAEKSQLRRRAGLDSPSQTSLAGNTQAPYSASPQGPELRFGRHSPSVRPKPYDEPEPVRAPRRIRFRGR